jgi:hypothetical protein
LKGLNNQGESWLVKKMKEVWKIKQLRKRWLVKRDERGLEWRYKVDKKWHVWSS